MELAAPGHAALLEPALAALARGEPPEGARLVKQSHVRQVLHVPLAGAGGAFLKWSWRRRPFWRRPDAAVEYRNLVRVRAAGIAAVEPLAWGERRIGRRHETVLVTRAAEDSMPVRELLGTPDAPSAGKLLAMAAALARRLHQERLWHRDLHAGNLLHAEGKLVLVDLQKLVALPFALPAPLRVRDLVGLVSDGRLGTFAAPAEIASAYLAAAPGGPALPHLTAQLSRACARAERVRLASRARRCVVSSTGFRIERRGSQRVLRRADVTTRAALEAAAHAAVAGTVPSFHGGPPPGPAPDSFARGQGSPEADAPADAAACLRSFAGGPDLGRSLALAHPGLRAWRLAHALLLRGLDTPAPLALVETRRLGWVTRSVLITRGSEDTAELAEALREDGPAARAAGATLARLHALGAELCGAELRVQRASRTLLALAPEGARLHRRLSPSRADRDLALVVRDLAEPERATLLEGYRDSVQSWTRSPRSDG